MSQSYKNEALRSVEVTYDNGTKIKTSMAAGLSDAEIKDYFKVGKQFNIGSGSKDKLVKVKSVKILSEDSINEKITADGRELGLFIDNDSQLYNSRFMPIIKNLSRKMKSGKFDIKLAAKGFKYLVDDGAKKYAKEFGNEKEWITMFSKEDRLTLAIQYAEEFKDMYDNQEYDFMKHESVQSVRNLINEKENGMVGVFDAIDTKVDNPTTQNVAKFLERVGCKNNYAKRLADGYMKYKDGVMSKERAASTLMETINEASETYRLFLMGTGWWVIGQGPDALNKKVLKSGKELALFLRDKGIGDKITNLNTLDKKFHNLALGKSIDDIVRYLKKTIPAYKLAEGMTLDQIKKAVDSGKKVHWANKGYTIIKDTKGQYLITHDRGNTIGLTWRDGKTLNGEPKEFFLAESITEERKGTGYKKLFVSMMKKAGIASPGDFKSDEEKKNFFDKVDAAWDAGDNEGDVDETTTNANVAGYNTPGAFSKDNKSAKKKESKLTAIAHGTFAKSINENIYALSTVEDWADEIKKGLKLPWIGVTISTLGGAKRASIIFKVSLDKKEDWANKIWQNSRYGMFTASYDGTLEMYSHDRQHTARFRKTKIKTAKDVITKINKWASESETMNETKKSCSCGCGGCDESKKLNEALAVGAEIFKAKDSMWYVEFPMDDPQYEMGSNPIPHGPFDSQSAASSYASKKKPTYYRIDKSGRESAPKNPVNPKDGKLKSASTSAIYRRGLK